MAKRSDDLFACTEFFEKIRVFVTTREKIKHPEGTELFDSFCRRLRELAGEVEQSERAALSHAAGQEGEKKVDWIAENHHDYWVVSVLCADTPRFYSIRKSDGQMLELPNKDSPFVPFTGLTPAQPPARAEVGRDALANRLRKLLDEYWNLAYAEGADGRAEDTPAGDAQRVLYEIEEIIRALAASSGRKGGV